MAPSPLVQNHAETWLVFVVYRQIKYRQIAEVSACCSDAVAQKTYKLTFCPRARRAGARRIIVNKITEQLFLSIKVTSPCCDDLDQSRNVRRLHSPVKLEPLEASSLGGPWWWCFLFSVVCCVLLCVQEAVGYPEYPPLAHTLSTTYPTMVSYYV